MDRDEILNRNKDSKPKDEGVEFVENKSRRYGEIGFTVIFILLVFYNFAKGLPIYDLLAIFWGYLGMSYVYKYRAFKTKAFLVTAILRHLCSAYFFAGLCTPDLVITNGK